MNLRNVTLECSLKPFKSVDQPAVEAVCLEMFTQWHALTRHADGVSVMLWAADGSEILEYRGQSLDWDKPLEWARYIGYPNKPKYEIPTDPEKKALHSRSYLYMENPPVITYGDLARIIQTIKRIGRQVTGKPIRVGATFDTGGEFAKSPFKYEKHPEICLANTMGAKSFVCCYGVLNADGETYAGFPQGIPQGTLLGTFLGRQSQHFLTDLGYDYLWFSNGFGFGMETWRATGPLFDGKRFDNQKAPETSKKILDFWRAFRAECPTYRIETRGTNLGTGVDLATDATSLKDIYDGGFNIETPPNSPWAAINGDFGIELVGYMGRIAHVPAGNAFPFRYYTHDPWWLNSPWLDRYGRQAHDIYLPMAISRLDEKGQVQTADSIEILTVDDSYGRMPVQVPNEVTPVILEGRMHQPDQAGPLLWLYPFDEYHRMVLQSPGNPELAFFADWFMRSAVNSGLPLNTVMTTTNYVALAESPSGKKWQDKVLVTAAPLVNETTLTQAILKHVAQGGRLLLYGPIDMNNAPLVKALNLAAAPPIDGELDIQLVDPLDRLKQGSWPSRINHPPVYNAGGCGEVLADASDPHTRVLAWVSQGDDHRRVAAMVRHAPSWNGGSLAWVRGTNSMHMPDWSHILLSDDPAKFFNGGLLMRWALAELGDRLAVELVDAAKRLPVLAIARHDNSYFFNGYMPDTTATLKLKYPAGAPLLLGYETELVDGQSTYRLSRAWRNEVAVFVQQADGVVSCIEQHSGEVGIERRLLLTGLKNATVRYFAPVDRLKSVKAMRDPQYPYFVGDFPPVAIHDDRLGQYAQLTGITGELMLCYSHSSSSSH